MRASYLWLLAALILSTAGTAAQSSNSTPEQLPEVTSTQLLEQWPQHIRLHLQQSPGNPAQPFSFRYEPKPTVATPQWHFELSRRLVRDMSSSFLTPKPPILIAGPERCYALRDYGFNADGTRVDSFSSCLPSKQAQLKATELPGRFVRGAGVDLRG